MENLKKDTKPKGGVNKITPIVRGAVFFFGDGLELVSVQGR